MMRTRTRGMLSLIKDFAFMVRIAGTPRQQRDCFRWFRSRRSGYLIETGTPWITFNAARFLDQAVCRGANVFEYGSGGSTLFWLDRAGKLVSVEHDRAWYDRMKKLLPGDSRVDYRLAEPLMSDAIGPDGAPEHDGYMAKVGEWRHYSFKEYVCQIDEFPEAHFDVVMIDGRARVACIRHSIGKVKIGGYLVLDNAERGSYLEKADPCLRDFELRAFPGYGPASRLMWQTNIYTRIQ